MAAPSKTFDRVLLALQPLAANSVVVSAEIDCSTLISGLVVIRCGRSVVTAMTAGVAFRIEGTPAAAGNMDWGTLAPCGGDFTLAVQLGVTTESAAAQKELTMSNTTGYAVGDWVFVLNATLANSEWHRVALIHASTHLTVVDNLANIQQTTALVTTKAERFLAQVDLTNVRRLRLVADASATTQATYVQAKMATFDSFA